MGLGRVFVSYSRDDDVAVLKLVQDLRSGGVDVWLDQTDIPSGRRWDEAIEQALADCDQLIAVLSEASVASQNVMDEVSYAIDEGKRVIPVIIRNCRIPLRLRRMQYVDLTSDYDARVEKLVTTLTGGETPPETASPRKGSARTPASDSGSGKVGALKTWAGSSQRLKRAIAAAAAVSLAAIAFQFLPRSSDGPSNVSSGLPRIEVWKVGSPHQGDTPDATPPLDLQVDARELGFELAVRSFPAAGFAAEFFQAFEKNVEPDILVFDNYGIVEGITTDRGSFDGIASSRRVKEALTFVDGSLDAFESANGGWQVLLTTSRNHRAARSLALRRPRCESAQEKTREKRTALANETLRDVRKYIVDSAMFSTRPDSDFNLSMCGLWGNRTLAFVNTVVVFEEQQRLGWEQVLVMMANSRGSWDLLNMGGNVDLLTELEDKIELADDGQTSVMANEALRVLAPVDGVSSGRDVKPQLEWQWTSEPGQLAFYLLESQFGDRDEWSASHFRLVLPTPSSNVKLVAPFGVGAQPHRWKVWAVGPRGAFTRTDWRIINYTS